MLPMKEVRSRNILVNTAGHYLQVFTALLVDYVVATQKEPIRDIMNHACETENFVVLTGREGIQPQPNRLLPCQIYYLHQK